MNLAKVTFSNKPKPLLPVPVPVPPLAAQRTRTADWLTAPSDSHALAAATYDAVDNTITLENGLARRTFVTSPSFGTIDFASGSSGSDSALRHVYPEGGFELNGSPFLLGGLTDPGWNTTAIYNPHTKTWAVPTQNGHHSFLNRTGLRERLVVAPNAWTYQSHHISRPEADIPFTPGRRNSPTYTSWPPAGVRLSVKLKPPAGSSVALQMLNVTLVYELYDGAPLLSKWLEVSAAPGTGTPPVLLDAVTTEVLAVNCDFSPSSKSAGTGYGQKSQLSRLEVVETATYGVGDEHSGGQWTVSPNQTDNDPGACEPIYASRYNCCGNESSHPGLPIMQARGPAVNVGDPATDTATATTPSALAMQKFVSSRTVLLLHDSQDATRQMMGRHQVYRRLTPWVQENQLEIHPAVTGWNWFLTAAINIGP